MKRTRGGQRVKWWKREEVKQTSGDEKVLPDDWTATVIMEYSSKSATAYQRPSEQPTWTSRGLHRRFLRGAGANLLDVPGGLFFNTSTKLEESVLKVLTKCFSCQPTCTKHRPTKHLWWESSSEVCSSGNEHCSRKNTEGLVPLWWRFKNIWASQKWDERNSKLTTVCLLTWMTSSPACILWVWSAGDLADREKNLTAVFAKTLINRKNTSRRTDRWNCRRTEQQTSRQSSRQMEQQCCTYVLRGSRDNVVPVIRGFDVNPLNDEK